MQLADSVPKMTRLEGGGTEEEISAAAMQTIEKTGGRVLILSDEGHFSLVAPAARRPRTVSAVTGGDALPAFGLPDARGVFAVGGEGVMRAARFYAKLKKAACTLVPTSAELVGVFEERGRVRVGGDEFLVSLPPAEVLLGEELLRPTLAEGYARLLLARLGRFGRRAYARFGGLKVKEEEPFDLFLGLTEPKPSDVLRKNAVLGQRGDEGGEEEVLAADCGNFAAFEALTSLYAAFFRCGSPLFRVPDYRARARAAGVPYASVRVPAEDEYARRALILEGRRGEFLRELDPILRGRAAFRRTYRRLGGEVTPAPREKVRYLPERAEGLTSVIRDFGLMENV